RDTGGVAAPAARGRVDRVAVPREALGELLGTPLNGLPVLVEDLVAAGVQLDTVVGSGVVNVQVHGLADAVLAGAGTVRDVEVAQDVGGRQRVAHVLEVVGQVVQLADLLFLVGHERDVVHLRGDRGPRRHEG